jgi:uncharacterized membrane protein
VSRYDWLLFLHMVGAAAIFAALALFTAALVGARNGRSEEAVSVLGVTRVGGLLFDVGGLLLLVFGIWLAFDADYGLMDEWVVGALVVYVVAAYAGTRTRVRLLAVRDRLAGAEAEVDLRALVREKRAAVFFYALTVASVLILLLLMIFKPGAH